MESNENFFISDTSLVQYTGPGGDVVVPEGIDELCQGAFQYRDDVTRVHLPNTVEVLGYEAFGGCYEMVDINLPDSIWKMQIYAFEGCANLREIELPKHLKFLGAGCFADCDALLSLTLPESIEFIGEHPWDPGLPIYATPDSYAWNWCIQNKVKVKDVATKSQGVEARPHKWWISHDQLAGE